MHIWRKYKEYIKGKKKLGESKVYESIRETLMDARKRITNVVNNVMVQVYWEIGREIVDEIGKRAEYGQQLRVYLSEKLTTEFGSGFSERN